MESANPSALNEFATRSEKKSPDEARRADEVGLLGRRPPDADHEQHEDRDEDDRVDEGQRVLERERERIQRREGEEHDLDRVGPFELYVGVELARVALFLGDAPNKFAAEGAPRELVEEDVLPVSPLSASGNASEEGLARDAEPDGRPGGPRSTQPSVEGRAVR